MTQWAAVMTNCFVSKVPPQNGTLLRSFCLRPTCQGCSFHLWFCSSPFHSFYHRHYRLQRNASMTNSNKRISFGQTQGRVMFNSERWGLWNSFCLQHYYCLVLIFCCSIASFCSIARGKLMSLYQFGRFNLMMQNGILHGHQDKNNRM